MLAPIFFKIINPIRLKLSFIIFAITLVFILPNKILNSSTSIIDCFEFKKNVEKGIKCKGSYILSGSNTYFAVREKRSQNKIFNYWMYSIKNNTTLPSEFNNILKSNSFRYVVVENSIDNLNIIQKNIKYKILYKNNIGIFAEFEIN